MVLEERYRSVFFDFDAEISLHMCCRANGLFISAASYIE